MEHFAGLDVSLEETSISIVDSEGRIVVEKKVASQPASIAGALNSAGFTLKRVGLEAGPLSPWLHAGLCAAGFAVICIETRQVKAALKAMRNKTDRNDARGIAQIMRTGWFRMVHVKAAKATSCGFSSPTARPCSVRHWTSKTRSGARSRRSA